MTAAGTNHPTRARWSSTFLLSSLLTPVAGIALFVMIWELAVWVWQIPAYQLPAPSSIAQELASRPLWYLEQAQPTTLEALAGLGLALLVALGVAVLMALRPFVERGMQPVLVTFQLVPMVCYAPAFVIWFGPGFRPIMTVAALFAVIPLIYALVAGLRSADADTIDMLHSAGIRTRIIIRLVHLPSALPSLFAGLRTALGLALTGAVLAEWFALTDRGLGVQMYRGISTSNAVAIWASAATLTGVGVVALIAIGLVERRMLRHR